MKHTKQLLFILLALCMIAGLLPWTAVDAHAEIKSYVTVIINGNGTVKLNESTITSGQPFELNAYDTYTITMTPAEGLILKKLERSEPLGGITDLTGNNLSGPDGNGAYIYSTMAELDVTYYVTFAEPEAAPTYTITGITMGGSGYMSFSVDSQTVTSAEAGQRVDITLPAPDQDYYWELSTMDAVITQDDANHFHFTMPEKSITVQARYLGGVVVINTHSSVYFNANGGTGLMPEQIIANGQTATLYPNAFTRDGYSFTGWNTAADGSGTPYSNQQYISPSSDLTLYAQWSLKSSTHYTIHFYPNAGEGVTGTMADQAITIGQTQALTANAFTRNGYFFAGWKDGFGRPYTNRQSICPTSDLNLYAQWSSSYTVHFTYNRDSGDFGYLYGDTMADQTFHAGETKKLSKCTLTAPYDFTFIGWSTTFDGDAVYTDEQEVCNLTTDANITLYGQWRTVIISQKVTVHFDANGGTGTMADQVHSSIQWVQLTPNTFTREGYSFTGWNTAADGSGTAYRNHQNINYLSDLTLYAQWSLSSSTHYAVHFNANGGSGTMFDQAIEVGKSANLTACAFTRNSYCFAGWNTKVDGSDATTFANGAMVSGLANAGQTVNLYAQWTQGYTVSITPGANMTKTSGDESQNVTAESAMTAVVYRANTGYYFPESYANSCTVTANSGVTVTRNGWRQITVSGTPTAAATITLTAATAKTKPAAPTAGKADCTTAANNDGKLTGVTTAMEYKKSGAESWTDGTGDDITGLAPGTYYVRVKATDTTLASDNQTLTIAGFTAPTHPHRFTYSASGATITATCTAEGCTLPPSTQGGTDHVATLTIAATGGTYDGTTSFGATITDDNSIQGAAKVQYQKKTDGSYGTATETAPTHAGDYKASITLGEGNGAATASVTYSIIKQYPVWVGGVQVTSANMNDVLGDKDGTGATVTYTPADSSTAPSTPATLTLNGANIKNGSYNSATIYAKGDLTIDVTGDSTVTGPDAIASYGVFVDDGKVTITGSGTLTATGGKADTSSYGVYAQVAVTVDVNGTLNAKGGTSNASSIGVYADEGAITVTGTLNAEGGTANYFSYGVFAYDGAITVNGTLNAKGGESSNGKSYGVSAFGSTVNGTLIATGNTQAIWGAVKNAIAGIGWTDAAGTTGKENIAVSTNQGQDLTSYKKVQFPGHEHSFTYSANGATITATCGNTDGYCTLPPSTEGGNDHIATLTIAAEGGTYDGTNAFSATVTNNIPAVEGDTVGEVEYYKVNTGNATTGGTKQDSDPINAGYYYASVTLTSGGNPYTAVKAFTVAKADPGTPTVTMNGYTYGGTVSTPSIGTYSGGGTVTYFYNTTDSASGGTAWENITATTLNANTYYMYAVIAESDNYNSYTTATASFTVSKADQTAPAAPTAASTTINSITLTAIENGEYKMDDGEWQASPIFTGLTMNKSYTFRQRYAAYENHNVSVSSNETVIRTNNHSHEWGYEAQGATITATCGNTDGGHTGELTAQITVVKPEKTVYGDSNSAEATITGSIDGVTNPNIVYKKGSETLNAAPTDAGTYTANITLGEGEGAKTAYVEYTISPMALTITGATATDRAYDKDSTAVTISAVTFKDSSEQAVTLEPGEDKDYTVTGAMTDANAGDGKNVNVSVTLKNANYSLATSTTTTTVNISKAAAQTISDVTDTLLYTATSVSKSVADQMPDDAGTLAYTAGTASSTGSVTVSDFAVNESGTVTATLSGGAANDTVTLPVTIGSTNYADSTVNVVITLTPKEDAGVSITDVPESAMTYGDADFTLTGSVTNEGTGTGNWIWTSSDSTVLQITANGTSATVKILKAGSATVTAKYESDTTLDTKTTDTITVNTKTITIAAKNQSIYVGGTLPTLSGTDFYTVTGLVGEETLTTDPSLTYQKNGETVTPDNTTAGTYDIVPSGAAASANYNISYANGTLTISNKGTQTISAENLTVTYGDTDKSISGSVTDPATGSGAISYAVKSGDAVTVNPTTGTLTIVKAGSAVITVTAAETDTYAQATRDVNVTVNTKAMTVSASGYTGYYDKAAHGITVTVTDPDSGYTVKYGAEEGSYTLDASPTQTEVGELTVYYQVTADNYTAYTGSAKVTVNAKQTQTITAENVTATYGDTNKSVSATTDGNGAISYAVKDGSGDYISIASDGKLTIMKVPTDSKAYVVVTAAETQICAQATKEVTVTINKANAVPATVTANNRTYEGTEKPLVTVDNSTLAGGEMWYALGENATTAPADNLYTISVPSKTDVGTYYVWYKAAGDDDHNSTEAVPVTATINPVDKAKLETAITTAETYYNSIKDNPLFASVAETLKKAIDTAKTVVDNKNVTASEVEGQITAIDTAVDTAKKEAEAASKEEADKAKAKAVTDLINALPAEAGVKDKEAVAAARAAYDKLTDAQKKLVADETLAKLTAAEAQVKAAEEAAEVIDIAKCTITAKNRIYTGEAIVPEVTVMYGETRLKEGRDYTLSCEKAKIYQKVMVTVKGKGKFKGSRKVYFKIIPKGTEIARVTGGTKQFTVEWKKRDGVMGYYIQYSLHEDFSKGNAIYVKGVDTLSVTVRKPKAGRTYYVRLRTYVKRNNRIYFSAWSETMRTGSAKTNEAQVVETAMNVGEALDLNALVSDGSAWKSDNDGIATVSAEGIVKALAAGSAEFTGLDGNGEQVTVIITISDENVLEPDEIELGDLDLSDFDLGIIEDFGMDEEIQADEELELTLG